MDLEVARADRHLDALGLPARRRRAPGRRPTRLRRRSAARVALRGAARASRRCERLELERRRPELPAARGAGRAARPRGRPRARAAVPGRFRRARRRARPSGIVACLRTPGAKSRVGLAAACREARARSASMRSSSSLSSAQRQPGGARRAARPCGRRGSARARRRRPAGRVASPSRSAAASSSRVVADDPDLCRLDPEREQRARQVGPVEVAAVTTDELRAGDEDRRAQAVQSACTPWASRSAPRVCWPLSATGGRRR